MTTSTHARAWATVAAGFAVVAVSYLVLVRTATGRHVDGAARHEAMHLGRHLAPPVWTVLAASPPVVVAVAAVVVIAGLVTRRPLLSLTTVLLVGVAEAITEATKALLVRPGGLNTLPSGHLTVIAGLVVSLVVACPPRWRRSAVVVGVAVVVASGVGTWVVGWHRPSDSFAALGVLLGCWGVRQLACGWFPWLRLGRGRIPSQRPPHPDPPTVPIPVLDADRRHPARR